MNSLYVSFNGFYPQEMLERWLQDEEDYEALNECVGYVSENAYEGDNLEKIIDYGVEWLNLYFCLDFGKFFEGGEFMKWIDCLEDYVCYNCYKKL